MMVMMLMMILLLDRHHHQGPTENRTGRWRTSPAAAAICGNDGMGMKQPRFETSGHDVSMIGEL